MSGAQVGMLWFDNDPKSSLQEKIAKARSYYARKYCLCPSWVVVNAGQVSPEEAGRLTSEMRIAVRVSNQVLPHHLWMGEGE